jgi:anti-anti-sigma factor
MIFRTKQRDDLACFVFHTPNLLNGMDIEAVETALSTSIDGGARRLVLDFHRVQHVSSQALSMILRVHLRLKELAGGKLILCGLSPQMMDAVNIMRLDRLIPIVPTRRDAVHAHEKSSHDGGKIR